MTLKLPSILSGALRLTPVGSAAAGVASIIDTVRIMTVAEIILDIIKDMLQRRIIDKLFGITEMVNFKYIL